MPTVSLQHNTKVVRAGSKCGVALCGREAVPPTPRPLARA